MVGLATGLIGGWHFFASERPQLAKPAAAGIGSDSAGNNARESGSPTSSNQPNRKVRVLLPGPTPIRPPVEAAEMPSPGTASGTQGARSEPASVDKVAPEAKVLPEASAAAAPAPAAAAPAAVPRRREAANENRCDIAACSSKYRSFRASDCTYQPYRGTREVCEIDRPQVAQPRAADAFASTRSQVRNCDVQRCSRQYRSFDSASCTYQPYDGGPRKTCDPR
jgi:hypothetical protein